MRKSSWIVLGICALLIFGLVTAYFLSQAGPDTLTQPVAESMVKEMQTAVRHKSVNTIMSYLAPSEDLRIANLRPEQIRTLLARAFQAMPEPRAEVNNLTFAGGDHDATVGFDLVIHNDGRDHTAVDYSGHITLQLQRVAVPHLMGLYTTREWRIVGGSTTGPDPSNFGDY
jgi:hypothetical protein